MVIRDGDATRAALILTGNPCLGAAEGEDEGREYSRREEELPGRAERALGDEPGRENREDGRRPG